MAQAPKVYTMKYSFGKQLSILCDYVSNKLYLQDFNINFNNSLEEYTFSGNIISGYISTVNSRIPEMAEPFFKDLLIGFLSFQKYCFFECDTQIYYIDLKAGLVMTYPNIPSFFAYLYDINYDEIKNEKNHPFYQLNDYLYDYLYNILSNNYSNKKLDLFPKQIARKYKFEKIKSGI